MATAAGPDRKIDIGRTMQRGFEAIGRHVPAYAGLSLLLGGLPNSLATYLMVKDTASGNRAIFTSPYYWGVVLAAWLCGALLQATLVRSAILDLSGRPADIGASLLAALKLILPLIGLTVLSAIVRGVGFVLLIVPGIIVYIMLVVSVPVLVEERLGVVDSMARSQELTKGSRWRILGLLLIFLLFYILLAATLDFAASRIGSQAVIGQVLADGVVGTINALLVATMTASLYVELRTVKEGATTESLAAIFD
jgi:uncharacterized membrane protein (DUF485 family)